MVKKHKITEWYHIQLECDKCGSVMNPSKLIVKNALNNDMHYESFCPECGNIVNTGSIQYPHTRYMFETKGEPDSDEGPYEEVHHED